MKQYRKKPVVILAQQYRNADSWPEGVERAPDGEAYIDTLEGRMTVSEGDYVITGVNGEKYPCKPDIFAKTYEEVGEECNEVEVEFRTLDSVVFPSNEKTINVVYDEPYGGAHLYHIDNCEGFHEGSTVYRGGCQRIQFVKKNDDGTIIPGLQSEQLAYVLLDRAIKLNARVPSTHNEKQIAGLKMFIEGCEDRVRERIERGVMGELKQ